MLVFMMMKIMNGTIWLVASSLTMTAYIYTQTNTLLENMNIVRTFKKKDQKGF